MILPAGRRHAVVHTEILVDRLAVDPVRRADRRERVARRFLGEQRQAGRLDAFPHRLRQSALPREHVLQSFRLHDLEDFLQSNDQGDGRRKRRLVLGLILAFLLEVEIERGILRFVGQPPGLLAHADERHARRQHQRLLRAGDDHVQSPRVGLDVEDTQRRDGIHHENRVVVRFDDVAQRLHVMRHAGGRFARLHVDGLDGRILFQRVRDGLRIHRMAPLHFDLRRLHAEGLAQFAPPLAEFAAVDEQGLVAG